MEGRILKTALSRKAWKGEELAANILIAEGRKRAKPQAPTQGGFERA